MHSLAGTPLSAGGHVGRQRRQLRASFPRTRTRSSSACSTRPMRQSESDTHPPHRTQGHGLALLPARRAARASSTAIASTDPTTRPRDIASIPTRSCSIPYAKRDRPRRAWDDSLFGYKVGDPAADLSFDERDSAAVRPAGRRRRHGVHLGRRPPAAHALASRRSSTKPHVKGLHEAASRRARGAARHLRRARLARRRSSI